MRAPEQRASWVADKNLQVFSRWHLAIPGFEVDLFVTQPFEFGEAYARASVARLGTADVTVASIDDLIAMKRVAGRARDEEDVEALSAFAREAR